MENTKTEAAALTVAHDSAVAHEAAGTGSPPGTGGMAAPPIPRDFGLANEFPSSMEKTKTEAAALTVVHDYAIAHEAAGTGSPGTAPVTGGMAAPPIPRASGLVNEFPITIHGFYMEVEVHMCTLTQNPTSVLSPSAPAWAEPVDFTMTERAHLISLDIHIDAASKLSREMSDCKIHGFGFCVNNPWMVIGNSLTNPEARGMGGAAMPPVTGAVPGLPVPAASWAMA
ncbi:hypothetical protein B0H14DRAFT_2559505 [Mycena olivaceomarginata]|nr:hypothetical protein B0H14DRAFT_2559505 [Mycena olivaceomarginata]